jgi:tetratricopeptide (TPR) repeat protein
MRASCLSVIAIAILARPLGTVAARAQTPTGIQPLATPDADALASEMRLLAANPLDLNALIRAGELTLKLEDPTAAATFFARAERIDPRNPRIKAGMGSLLVAAERPGEALRRFNEAETLGYDGRNFAADRGLAYDLIGEQERAQRDYRMALKYRPDDETVRRYALSLGISGKRDKALEQLDPLLRKSDRGAWRTRAFILAMGGDLSGAERIATTMMPAGLAQGLQPFFERLPTLSAADRAFAVHFGEVRPTPERIADARLVPALAPLAPEPGEAVAVAAVAAQPTAAAPDRRKDKKRKRDHGRAELATATTPPPPAPPPLPAPPAYVAGNQAQFPPAPPVAAPARAASASIVPAQPVAKAASPFASAPTARPPLASSARRPATAPIADPANRGLAPAARQVIEPPLAATSPRSVPAAPPSSIRAADAAAQPKTSANNAIGVAAADVTTHGIQAAAAPIPGSVRVSPLAPVRSEDSILAAIIANIAVPGSELVEQASSPASVAVQSSRADPAPASPLGRTAANGAAPGRVADARATADRAADAKAAADRKTLADKKALADRKALADKKIADAKKAADAKKVADAKKAAEEKKKNDPKRLEPARVWVQVAGGATVGDLPKQWARVHESAPALFKGKQGWTTPLRATNRLLTGPFKSDDEAQAFVNALAKTGISAFTFSSEAGQKIEKLPAK